MIDASIRCGREARADKAMNKPDWLLDGPANARRCLILAHGGGQGMRSEFMEAMARELGTAGLRVVRFQFPYMMEMERTGKRRPPDRPTVLLDAWHQTIDHALAEGIELPQLLIGGKSLGGRMASLIADERSVAGLLCLGYPFHPPGKPDRLRIEHLQTLRTPALICQGTRDPFGNEAEVSTYSLSPALRFAWIDDGEHSFRPRKGSGTTWERNLAAAADAVRQWVAGSVTLHPVAVCR
jgi:predicted alpha/beta-hydrolase family hydrolase